MDDWVAKYRPLIGSTIKALIWMPITSDTPDLIQVYKSSSFSFSGAVFLAFEPEGQLFLTWRQKRHDTFLGMGPDFAWVNLALDRVRCDPGDTWGAIEGGTLMSAEFFSAPSMLGERSTMPLEERVVGVRHEVDTREGRLQLWIGTGGEDFIGDHDDLWVGIGLDPPNLQELIKLA